MYLNEIMHIIVLSDIIYSPSYTAVLDFSVFRLGLNEKVVSDENVWYICESMRDESGIVDKR